MLLRLALNKLNTSHPLKILLIGANGQVGLALKNALRSECNLQTTTRKNLDCSKINKVKKFFIGKNYDMIINAVAYTNVDEAEKKISIAYAINKTFPQELARISKSIGSILVHFSTDYVFNGRKKKAYLETDRTFPVNVYGKSKLAGEKVIKKNCHRYFIFRTSWVMGEHGNNFIRKILKLGRKKKEIKVVNDQYGVPTCTNLICKVIISLIDSIKLDKIWPYGIYHLTPRGKTTWYNMTFKIFKNIKNKKLKLKFLKKISPISSLESKLLPKRPKNSLLNNTKIKKKINFNLPFWERDFTNLSFRIIKNYKIS
jgi:dTDP-4-dehydrorhamnose reductase